MSAAVAPSPTAAAPQLLKVNEVARRLGISRSATYALMDAGALAYHRLGKACRRISESDLAAYLARTRVGGAA